MPTVSVFARLPRTSFLPCTKETMRAIRSGQLSLRHGGRSGPARLYERLLLWSFGPIRILSAHENTSRAETGLCHLVSIPCAGPQARPHTDGCARNSWGLVDGSFCDRAHRRRTPVCQSPIQQYLIGFICNIQGANGVEECLIPMKLSPIRALKSVPAVASV